MMKKIKQAQQILNALGLPKPQQNELSALTLLALCDIKPGGQWKDAQRKSKRVTKEIMSFVSKYYKRKYAPNTRETFRRQVLHQFVQAGIADYNPDKPDLPVNSPNAHYAISNSALSVINIYGSEEFEDKANTFVEKYNRLITEIRKARISELVPVTLGGVNFRLSPGKHNEVEVAVINEFATRFAIGGKVVYLSDAENKNLFHDEKLMKKLNLTLDEHSKMPDVLIYREYKNWLYLIEAVTSHGPVTPKRIIELEEMTKECKVGKIYVSAFPDFTEFKRHLADIAWETEVWIAEKPDHLIHYNGDKFIGPRI